MGLLILLGIAMLLVVGSGTVVLGYALTHPRRKTLADALAHNLPSDPSELGLVFKQRSFRLIDGSSSPGWIMTTRSPQGPVVVITHGFADSRYGALTWVPLLVDFASSIVVYDLRAHGDSSAKLSRLDRSEVHDLLAVIDQLDKRNRNHDIVLFGYSLGAGISIAAAAKRQEHVVGVIADAAYRTWAEPIIGQMWSRRWPPYPFVWLTRWSLSVIGISNHHFDRATDAAKLTCPLLIMHGKDDPICRFTSAQQIAATASDATLVEFDGGGHGGLAAFDRDRYLSALRTFFDKIDRKGTSSE